MGLLAIVNNKSKIVDCICKVECSCGAINTVTAGAIYKQFRRGNDHYVCKSCAGLRGWTDECKGIASRKSKKKWHDPEYAGTIIGKAMTKEIRKAVNSEF